MRSGGIGPLTVMTRGAIKVPPVFDWAPVGVQVPPEPELGLTGQVCHRLRRYGTVVAARRATVCSPPAPRQRPLTEASSP